MSDGMCQNFMQEQESVKHIFLHSLWTLIVWFGSLLQLNLSMLHVRSIVRWLSERMDDL